MPIGLAFRGWGVNDAEDVAVQTFEVLWESRLLVRMDFYLHARLPSLLCSVTRKILANRHRVRAGRDRLARDVAEQSAQPEATEDQQIEVFYAAWVEDLLRRAVESIAAEYYREAPRAIMWRGALRSALPATDHCRGGQHTRHPTVGGRQLLPTCSATVGLLHCSHSSGNKSIATPHRKRRNEEFQTEWQQMGAHPSEHGGLEETVQRTYELMDPVNTQRNQQAGLRAAAERIAALVQSKSPPPPAG